MRRGVRRKEADVKKLWKTVIDFFGRIFFIFRHDIKKLFLNPIAAVLAVGLMVLPSLYAWFNIEASWDPYGNTGNLRVAVANCDEGCSLRGITVNVGNSIVDSLAANEDIGWLFMNEADAVEGVKSGEYYAAVVIPQEFSRDMMSVLTPDMARPELKYYVNEKTNAIAPKITGTAMTTVQKQVNASFIDQGMTVLCDTIVNLYDAYVNADLPKASDIDAEKALQNTIELLGDLSGNLKEMQTVIGVFQDTGETIDALLLMVQQTLDLSQQHFAAAGDAISAARPQSGLGDSLAEILDSLDVLMDAASASSDRIYDLTEDLAQSVEKDGKNAAAAAENLSGVIEDNEKIIRRTKEIFQNLENVFRRPIEEEKVTEAMKVTIPDLRNPEQTITLSLYDALKNTADSLGNIASRFESAENSLKKAKEDLRDLANRLENGGSAAGDEIGTVRNELKEAGSQITSAVKEFNDTARSGIENGMAYFADAADSLSEAGNELTSVFPYLDITITGGRDALSSAGDALDGTVSLLSDLNTTIGGTIENLQELKEDVHEIQSSVNVKTILGKRSRHRFRRLRRKYERSRFFSVLTGSNRHTDAVSHRKLRFFHDAFLHDPGYMGRLSAAGIDL